MVGMLPAYHWEAQLEVQPLLVVPGTGSLLALLACRSPLLLWCGHSQKSPVEGNLGFLVLRLRWLCKKKKKKWGHWVSPPILSHSSHCSPSNKWPLLTLPHPTFSCLCCDAIGLRPAFLKPLSPRSSLLQPGHRMKLRWVCHPPALKHATFIYLFLVLSPPLPAGDISGPRYRVLIGGSA